MALTTYAAPTAAYHLSDSIIGVPDIGVVAVASTLGAPGIGQLPSVTVEDYVGTQAKGQSLDAIYGGEATFILLAIPTSTTVTAGLMYTYKGDYSIVVVPTAVSSSAVSGLPAVLAVTAVTSNASSIQYTWFMTKGRGQGLAVVGQQCHGWPCSYHLVRLPRLHRDAFGKYQHDHGFDSSRIAELHQYHFWNVKEVLGL